MYAVSEFADFICELDQLKAVKRQITLPCDIDKKTPQSTAGMLR
jgi:hypothetical protein